jgi:hypothetical protein
MIDVARPRLLLVNSPLVVLLLASAVMGSRVLLAEEAEALAEPLPPDRLEWSGVPILGGNPDIGSQFGAAFSLAWYEPARHPYRWRSVNVNCRCSTTPIASARAPAPK